MNAAFPLAAPPVLTRCQRQVLDQLVLGRSHDEMAAGFGITRGAVEHQILNIRLRLGARNATHACALAVAYGLVDVRVLVAEHANAIQLRLVTRRAGRHTRERLDP